MLRNDKTWRQRVRNIMPDLEIKQLEISNEGLVNDVVIVNQKYVFRFAKTEEGAADLNKELCILELIRPTIGVSIPSPEYHGKDYMVYPHIDGEPLLLDIIKSWDESTQVNMAESLGTFLFNLHTTDISQTEPELPATLAPVTRERWIRIYDGIRKTVYPLLWKHQVTMG